MSIWEGDEYSARLTVIPSIYGVVERIREMLRSDVFLEIKPQQSDLLELETTLSDLHASFPQVHHELLSKDQRHLLHVERDIEGLKSDAYDVEDVLDLAATDHLKKKDKVKRSLPISGQMLHVSDLRGTLSTMRSLWKKIYDRLETCQSEGGILAAEKMSTFILGEKPTSPAHSPGFMVHTREGRVASPLELEDFIVGRYFEKDRLFRCILSPSKQEHPNTLLITGNSGIGKTTLAKLVCKDAQVSTSFGLVSWVPAGIGNYSYANFSSHVNHTIFEIIRSVTHQSGFYPQQRDSISLKRRLRDILQGQKYLLILDDFGLFDERDSDWLELMEIFKVGSTGSTVILTSRWYWLPCRMETLFLEGLSEVESWSLFGRCAGFDEKEEQQYPSLMGIRKSMVTKCRGNPLAIKILASMLLTCRDEHTWKHTDRIFRITSYPASTALRISIENMTYNLIQCFLTCAILFESKTAVSKEQLLYFWMAHGLLPSSDANKDLGDMVDAYCNELLFRGFIRTDCSDYHPNGTFQMHAGVCDIAKCTIERGYNYIDDLSYESRSIYSIGRHSLWVGEKSYLPSNRHLNVLIRKTRTLLLTRNIGFHPDQNVLEDIISKLDVARVLLLDCSNVLEYLPDAIGNLKLLRYLSLEGNHRLRVLPESTCKLVNLQTLDLSGCVQLETLPKEMHKLVSLRHLLLTVSLTSLPEQAIKSWTSLHLLKICYCVNLISLPKGIAQLTALQVLEIHDCPKLVARCQREKGEDWHLISHVPNIQLDHQLIQNIAPSHLKKYAGERPPSSIMSKEQTSVEHPHEATGEISSSSSIPYGSNIYEEDVRMQPPMPPPSPSYNSGDKQETEVEKQETGNVNSMCVRTQIEWQNLIIPSSEIKSFSKGILLLMGEDYEFEKEKLIQLWMAGGFISNEPMEINGAKYFEELMSQGYLLCSDSNSLYKVNSEKVKFDLDITSDKSNYLRLERASTNNAGTAEILHVSVVGDDMNDLVLNTLNKCNRLRTLLFLGAYNSGIEQLLLDLFLCFESLVVLDLRGADIKELPSSAAKMIHLRYLDLSWTLIEILPEAICQNEGLQTLRLKGCSRLWILPRDFKRLTKLRHLDFDVLGHLAVMPKAMGALVNLRTLSAFIVDIQDGCKLEELRNLDNITGEFCIARLEQVQSANEAEIACLGAKKNLKKLELRWSDSYNGETDNSILENLRPHSDLEELHIQFYQGTELPSWIADEAFQKLTSVTLFKCEHIFVLPSMQKLPSLEHLRLFNLNSVAEMDYRCETDGGGAFPMLKTLIVDKMLKLESWTEATEGDFPCLVELTIKDCPMLPELPSLVYLSTLLEFLMVEECPLIEESYSKQGGQFFDKIKHVPNILIGHDDGSDLVDSDDSGLVADDDSELVDDDGSEVLDDDHSTYDSDNYSEENYQDD